MEKIEVTLISGRTAKQGIGLEEGKPSTAYAESVNLVQLSQKDAEALGIEENETVTVVTDAGTVTVNWAVDQNLDEGIVFFPYGPWANQVYAAGTDSTGMPVMKGINASISKGEEKVATLEEIVESLRRAE